MKSVPIEFYPKAVSFSANEVFFTCAYSYYRQKIVKDIPYVEGKEAAWGNVLHSAIERAIKEHRLIGAETYKDPETGKEVTNDLSWLNQYFVPFVRFASENGAVLEAEKEICFSKPPFQKSDWFKAWWRTKSDVVIVAGDASWAIYVDYKTGNRKARSISKYQKQMRYAALALMVEYPEAQKVDTSLCWIKENGKMDGLSFTRTDIPKLLDEFATDVNEIAYAIQNNSWPKKKSGLCKGYCSVQDCSNWEERK
jgi:hypothetical protein